MRIIEKTVEHEAFVRDDLTEQFGSEHIITPYRQHRTASQLPGYLAEEEDAWVGVLLYAIHENACELVYIHTMRSGQGIGKQLLAQLTSTLKTKPIRRLWVITTNDNLEALAFYQKSGFRLVRLHPGAMDEVRKIKPRVPLTGKNGIPLRDILELEMHIL